MQLKQSASMHDLFHHVVEELRATWRYRWHALVVAWLAMLVGGLLVFSLPNKYESSARVYADTESLMNPLLKGLAVQPDVRNRIQLVARTLLSRPNLETVADKTGLSLRATTLEGKEELLVNLRDAVEIKSAGGDNLYTITYTDPDKAMAQKVVQALLQVLMNNTLGTNIENTQSAQTFLQQQVDDYNHRLNVAERKIADFEKANIGYIPSQGGDDYFTRLQNAETTLQKMQDQYDTLVAGHATIVQQMHSMATNPSSLGIDPRTQALDKQIASGQQQLNALLLRYTPEYPDVVALKRMIAQLQAQRDALQKNITGPSMEGVTSDNPVYQDLQKALYSTQVNIGTLSTSIALQKKQISDLKGKIDHITDVQTNLRQLTRNYDATQKQYNELITRLNTAQISQDATHSGNNLKFSVVDPPYVPLIPVSPKRGLLLALVFVFALGVGGVFAFFMHQITPVFLNMKSLRELGDYTVLGAFSMIVSKTQKNLYRRELVGFSATLILLLVVAVLGIVFDGHLANLVQHFFVMGSS